MTDTMDECSAVGAVPAKIDMRRGKRKCVLVYLTIAIIGGFLEGYLPEDGLIPFWLLELGMGLSSVITAMVWCYLDAEERGFTISFRLSLLLFLVLIAGFPYYVLKTRRNREALKTLGLAVLCLVLFLLFDEIAYRIGVEVYYLRWA
jgi:hypothetical protein